MNKLKKFFKNIFAPIEINVNVGVSTLYIKFKDGEEWTCRFEGYCISGEFDFYRKSQTIVAQWLEERNDSGFMRHWAENGKDQEYRPICDVLSIRQVDKDHFVKAIE